MPFVIDLNCFNVLCLQTSFKRATFFLSILLKSFAALLCPEGLKAQTKMLGFLIKAPSMGLNCHQPYYLPFDGERMQNKLVVYNK